MSRPLPVDHPLVVAIAKQLVIAMKHDSHHAKQGRMVMGPKAMAVLGELVSAAHAPDRLRNELQAIDNAINPAPSVEVVELQQEVERLTAILARGRDALSGGS